MVSDLQRIIGFDVTSLDSLKNITAEPITDTSGDYYIHGVGTFKFKFLDAKWIVQGVDYFRPVIRGFWVLLLLFFNFKQLLSFIGQDPGMYSRSYNDYKSSYDGSDD